MPNWNYFNPHLPQTPTTTMKESMATNKKMKWLMKNRKTVRTMKLNWYWTFYSELYEISLPWKNRTNLTERNHSIDRAKGRKREEKTNLRTLTFLYLNWFMIKFIINGNICVIPKSTQSPRLLIETVTTKIHFLTKTNYSNWKCINSEVSICVY